MADPHVILAPIVAPPLPPVPPEAPAALSLLPWAAALGALLLVAAGVFLLWRRSAALRTLLRIERGRTPGADAERLARWQRAHWPQAPQAWLHRLERLRFGPAGTDDGAEFRQLCAEARMARRAH